MKKYCIYKSYTIKETIESIEEHRNRVAIVLNKKDQVVGVVSQGDIIRALCAGKNIYALVEGIIKPNFLYLNDMDMEKAYQFFKKKKITLLPVITEDYKLKNVITLDTVYNYLEEKCKN